MFVGGASVLSLSIGWYIDFVLGLLIVLADVINSLWVIKGAFLLETSSIDEVVCSLSYGGRL